MRGGMQQDLVREPDDDGFESTPHSVTSSRESREWGSAMTAAENVPVSDYPKAVRLRHI